jgi:hypothetical protein
MASVAPLHNDDDVASIPMSNTRPPCNTGLPRISQAAAAEHEALSHTSACRFYGPSLGKVHGPSEVKTMRLMRHEAVGETTFDNISNFCFTLLLEILPISLAGLVCWVVRGPAEVKNRSLGFTLIMMDVLIFIPVYATIVSCLLWDTGEYSLVNSLSTYILLLGRAAVVATKYAFYSEEDVHQVGSKSGAYSRSKRLAKNQLANFCISLQGLQPAVLLEQIHMTSCKEGIDLSKVTFTVAPTSARLIWSDCKDWLRLAAQQDQESEGVGAAPASNKSLSYKGHKAVFHSKTEKKEDGSSQYAAVDNLITQVCERRCVVPCTQLPHNTTADPA